jgi:hypothetical protein
MSKVKCELISHSSSPHLSQLYTGFFLLHTRGVIAIKQLCIADNAFDKSRPQHLRAARRAHLSVILNDDLKVHYDTHDSIEVDADCLANCDFYFKRSFAADYVATNFPQQQHKLFPLGLNYHLLADSLDYFALQRAWKLKGSLREFTHSLVDILDTKNLLKGNPRPKTLHALPNHTLPPRVLFLVTAYDPHDDPERSVEKVKERMSINETRAECIRLLRKELGDTFFGGFVRKPFTERNYPELLISDDFTRKGNYLKTLTAFPICVASNGLHGSIGWKMAEYVAAAKSIVAEKLNYQVPGDFLAGDNYLEFSTPEECVVQCLNLIANQALRNEIMAKNAIYYRSYLEPAALVLNTLRKTFPAIAQTPYA